MKWIYGKQDWKTMERGLENCFLMTNYLGGFSSLTVPGAVSRNDHALLMACVRAPNHRRNMIHRLREELRMGDAEYRISTQEFAREDLPAPEREEGYRYLSCFTYEDTPLWRFQVKGAEIRKEIGLKRGANTVALRYEIRNRGREACHFTVTPFLRFTPKGQEPKPYQRFCFDQEEGRISSNGLSLYLRSNGAVTELPEETEIYYYRYDACDGRKPSGRAKANHRISLEVGPGKTEVLEAVYEMEPSRDTAEEILAGIREYRRGLVCRAGFRSEAANMLVKSADQFIARRESTGGETVLAGFPFFEDWGRDTMIALPGLCIATGRYESAKQILRTFGANERDGLMPNLFPEGQNAPLYNTADAALLFINCVYLYGEATGEESFLWEMYPVMERITEGYIRGTRFGIHMDEDGLILAGEGLWQVTWMDVRYGDILPTPRHGKPVEINAYWYNALRVMERLCARLEEQGAGRRLRLAKEYGELADRVRASFREQFWMEDRGCLKDVISGTAADCQIRCNQIWALSMPFTMLDRERERQVVDTVFEKLYTPYGLRTLEEADPDFHGSYGGSNFERDMAYHQGTVWTFPLGAYYLAYLKVHDHSPEAKAYVGGQLEVLESALREGCAGQLPEIYDGQNPTSSRGCFAQAWSVGELLRVYEALERD